MKHASAFAEAPLLSLDTATPITLDRDEVDNVPALPPTERLPADAGRFPF